MKIGNILLNILFGLSYIVCLWIFISFFDIILHNIETLPNCGQYLDWNFLIVFMNLMEGIKG
jgi:hypothetical protein